MTKEKNMIHRKCGTRVLLDLSSQFKLVSPSINISTSGVYGGMIELQANGSKTERKKSLIFYCQKCEEYFDSPDSIEENISFNCDVCQEEFSPSNLTVTEFFPKLCVKCLKAARNQSYNENFPNERKRILSLFNSSFFEKGIPLLKLLSITK